MSSVTASTNEKMPTAVAIPVTSPARMKAALPLLRKRLRTEMDVSVMGSPLLYEIEVAFAFADVLRLDDQVPVLHRPGEGCGIAAAFNLIDPYGCELEAAVAANH